MTRKANYLEAPVTLTAAASGLGKGLALAAYRHSLTREHISQQDLLKRRSASEFWVKEEHKVEGTSLASYIV